MTTPPELLAAIRSRDATLKGGEWYFLCPAHEDHHPSARYNSDKCVWVCDVCKSGGGWQDLAGRLDVPLAKPKHDTARQFIASYDYVNEASKLLYQVQRFHVPQADGSYKKDFPCRRPDGNGGWIGTLQDVRRVLFQLPELTGLTSPFVVEGEECVNQLRSLGIPATCNSGGAGKWSGELTTQLQTAGVKSVVILPDNDKPGRDHAKSVAQSCHAAGLVVKILTLPNLPPKGDIVDFLDAGGTLEQLNALVAATPVWMPGSHDDSTTNVTSGTVADEGCGLIKTLADRIQQDSFFAKDAGKLLYVFEGGTYRPQGKEFIELRVKQITVASGRAKRWSTRLTSEVFEFIRVDAPPLWERPSLGTINVLNGHLDWKTGTLGSHDPKHLSSVQIPVTYDPSATCPNWDRFVKQVFPADCHVLAYEIIGWLMIPDMSLQKAILLIGEGANGKSVYLSAVTAFLGRENTASLSLQRLEGDKFAAARLVGKLANICADLPSEHLASTSVFKAIVGGDYLLGERKFQGSFEFLPFCRLVFSTNHYPQSRDSSSAFFRRWVVIPFDRTFAPSEQLSRAVLDAQLADPSELSGVLNRALESLRVMQIRGGFTQSETTSVAAIEFVSMTDPVGAWLDHFTDADPAGMVSKKDLTIVYNAAAEANGRPAMSAKAFCSAVRRLRPTVQEAQRTICGSVQAVFLGLRLKDATSHNSTGRGTDSSCLSRHSLHSSQISPKEEEVREREEEEEIKIGNGVNHVNEGLFTEGPEEVVSDDH